MEILNAQEAQAAASAAAGAIHDVLGAQLITKTLDRLHTSASLTGAVVDQDYQFQKDVLQGIGLGLKVDAGI
ncbi:MAG: hypothetical protein LBP61_03860 [Desulfovibrio sp.]|jgi:hypothetical protein|nr:hypothetical protein [Desulfovibrio sp.]